MLYLKSAVKIIMDKISKRSKGYAFIEYTTEEAASVALEEMNGKVNLNMNVIKREGKTLDSDVYWLFLSCADYKRVDDSSRCGQDQTFQTQEKRDEF